MGEADVRKRFLEDHARLRGKAEVLESLALRILRGDEDLGSALRLKGEEILDHLSCHMGWEERELLPLLRQFGRTDMAEKLVAEHAAQRAHFEGDLLTLKDTERRPLDLAKHFIEFLRWLDRDMLAEEEDVLGALSLPPDSHARSRHRHSP
jgi:hypothetical protein